MLALRVAEQATRLAAKQRALLQSAAGTGRATPQLPPSLTPVALLEASEEILREVWVGGIPSTTLPTVWLGGTPPLGWLERPQGSKEAAALLQSIQSLVATAAKVCRALAALRTARAATARVLELAVYVACKVLPDMPGMAEQKEQNLTQHLRRASYIPLWPEPAAAGMQHAPKKPPHKSPEFTAKSRLPACAGTPASWLGWRCPPCWNLCSGPSYHSCSSASAKAASPSAFSARWQK